MGIERKRERQRFSEQRKQVRRNLITRTSKIWTRLYRELTSSLKVTAHNWLNKIESQARQNIASGYIDNSLGLPEKFTKTLERILRQAMAQGYWLNHLYVQELKSAKQGKKYHGKITLSDKDSDEELRELLNKFMSIDSSEEWHEVIPEEAVNWLKDYVPKLAGVLSEDVLEKTREVLRDSMMRGTTLQERMKALRESSDTLLKMTDARIESIARTEITRADSMGRLISMKGNEDVIGFEFSAIMDDRTTEICAERHGLVMRLDDPRVAENTPPLHVNCVLGDTFVLPIGGVSAISKRVFDGDICIIKTARGNHLAGTPNHPILTSRGWIPLSEIKKGDYVVCDSIGERGNIINGEHQQMIARIKDAASAFFDNGEMFSAPVPMTAEDFHHDGGQSNVAVIYTDRKLLDRMKSSTNEQVIEQRFIFGYVIRSFLKYCKSVLFFSLKRVRFPSFCFMSFLCKFQSFFKRSVLHSCKLLFMSIARLYAMFDKNAPDCIRCCDVETDSNTMHTYTLIMQSDDSFMVNGIDGTFPLNAMFEQNIINRIVTGAIFFAKFHNAESREIIFDNVVSVEQRRFNGHVYNLQTESGIFVANNIITHNCRSMLLSLTVYDYPDGVLTSHEFDEVPSGIQRESDIEEVRTLLGGIEKAVENVPAVPDARTRAEKIIRQNEEYRRQYEELQLQMDAAVSRRDIDEYNRLSALQDDVSKQWQAISDVELHNAKIEMAEQGVIYASGISKKLAPNDVSDIVQTVEGAPAPIRRVWNLLEDKMMIADTNSRKEYYSPSEGAVHIDFLSDKQVKPNRPRYGVLFHELGHLIDDKAYGLGRYFSGTDELRSSLASEVDSYIKSTWARLKRGWSSLGINPDEVTKAKAYAAVENELFYQLGSSSKIAVSDVFSGITKNKIKDGWAHSTSYWEENDKNVCFEFFAQTFSDSINNPEAIETTKKYFPESYKIFERMIQEIGEKK